MPVGGRGGKGVGGVQSYGIRNGEFSILAHEVKLGLLFGSILVYTLCCTVFLKR